MNQLVLSARIAESKPLRHTPAGIPASVAILGGIALVILEKKKAAGVVSC